MRASTLEAQTDMASITKVSTGWRARYRTPDGASRSRTFPRKVDAEAFLVSTEHKKLSGEYVDPSEGRRTTVAAFADQWVAAQPWRSATRERTESTLRTHVLPRFGDRPIGSLRPTELQSWARGLEENLAPGTVEAVVRTVRTMMSAAVDDGVLARSPASSIKLRRREGVMRTPLSVAEVRMLAEAIRPELSAAVVLAASAGLRQGELFGVTVDRVDFLRRELRVDRQLVTPAHGEPGLQPTKTARSVRAVPLSDHVLEVLAQHVESSSPTLRGFLFHRDGEPWLRHQAGNAFRSARKVADVDARGWHDLRHHCASVLINEGLSVTAVAATLGHSPAECLRTYAGWWPDESESIRAAMARAWSLPALSVVGG